MIDEAKDAIARRQGLGQRGQRTIELLDEDILVGPAGDADRVEIGDAPALRCKAGDCRLQKLALPRA